MEDKIIFSTGIFDEIPVSFLIAYKSGKPVYVDLLNADMKGRIFAGRIDKLSERPAGAFIRLDDKHSGFLERKYFKNISIYRKREGIDRTRYSIIDGDYVFVRVIASAKGNKRCVLAPFEGSEDDIRKIREKLDRGEVCYEDDESFIKAIMSAFDLQDPCVMDAREDAALAKELNLTYRLDSLLSGLLSKKVYLKSGANLVFEETETAVLVDVNTAKADGNSENVFKINLEAADAILEQVRLRHLSGMILVDFLKMSKEERVSFESFLNTRAMDNPDLCFHDITALGMGEFTVSFSDLSLGQKMAVLKKKRVFNS